METQALSISNVRPVTARRYFFDANIANGDDPLTIRNWVLAYSPGHWLVHSPAVRDGSGGWREVVISTPAMKHALRALMLDYLTAAALL
jgi:hypothetical protein